MHKVSTITKEKISEKLRSQLGLLLSLCEEITLYVFAEILNLDKKDQDDVGPDCRIGIFREGQILKLT